MLATIVGNYGNQTDTAHAAILLFHVSQQNFKTGAK